MNKGDEDEQKMNKGDVRKEQKMNKGRVRMNKGGERDEQIRHEINKI